MRSCLYPHANDLRYPNCGWGALAMVTEESSHRPAFTALDRFRVRDVGLMVTVELDRDTADFGHLVGQKIVIDGRLETCFSVERFSHTPPWKQGERVSLLIRKEG